jgi:signal peptide peptidase SppA
MNPHVFDKFFGQPWHIKPSAGLAFVQSVAESSPPQPQPKAIAKRPPIDAFGDALPQMMMIEDVALIPIAGALVKNATGFEKYFYSVISHEDIHEDLDKALREKVSNVVFVMNSPGGTVAGTPELADRIAEVSNKIPTWSFNENQSCSAAEFLTAGCTGRFATLSSINGSIGTIASFPDFSKMLEKFGITFHTFASGKYKGLGNPMKAPTDDHKAWMQEFVMINAGEFKGHMLKHRPKMKPEDMEGQILTGNEAFKSGLVDAVVRDLSEVLSLIRS